MAAAGAREIQLDAPAEAVQLVLGVRRVEDIVPWLTLPFRHVTRVRRTVHFCLGDMGPRPFTQEQHLHTLIPLLQALDGHVDRVHVECAYAGQWAERALLAEIPQSMEIIAGIADVKGPVQTVDTLRARVDALLAHLPGERLLVSSSCGCGRCPPEQARQLMTNLVAAARTAGSH